MFLDGSSPHSALDQKRRFGKTDRISWISLYSLYADLIYIQIKSLECDDSPISRAILKINNLIKVIKNLLYFNNSLIEKLCRITKNVITHRSWNY
jgi:hypothetical protein